MMNNCKGFVMVEALIVTTFVVTIFTFMYTSVVPLLGTYEKLENDSSIDSIYRLYAIRNEIYKNSNYFANLNSSCGTLPTTVLSSDTLKNIVSINEFNVKNITLYYVKDISSNKSDAASKVSLSDPDAQKMLSDDIKNYDDVPENVLFMYSEETKNGSVKSSVVHIGLAPDLTKPYVYHS